MDNQDQNKFLFDNKALIYLELLIASLIVLILVRDQSQLFLQYLPSSFFQDNHEKLLFNLVMLAAWLIINHSLIFLVKRNYLLSSKVASIFLISTLICSFVLASVDFLHLRNLVDTFYFIFGVGHLYPIFIDLRGFLAGINKADFLGDSFSVDCAKFDEPCIGWGWSYGSTALRFDRFGLFDEKYTFLFATFIFALYCYIMFMISKELLSKNTLILFNITGLSLIVIERMNIDILVFIILFAICKSTRNSSKLLSFLLLIIFSLTKYYTFFLIPFVILFEHSRRLRIMYSCLTLLAIPTVIDDLQTHGSGSLNFGYAATFGLKNLIGAIGGSPSPTFHVGITTVVTVAGALITFVLYFFKVNTRQFSGSNFSIMSFESKLFVLSSINIIFAWSVASNYPYRFVCIFGLIPFFVRYLHSNRYLFVLNIGLCLICMNSLPISLTIIRNVFFALFISNLLSLNIVLARSHLAAQFRF